MNINKIGGAIANGVLGITLIISRDQLGTFAGCRYRRRNHHHEIFDDDFTTGGDCAWICGIHAQIYTIDNDITKFWTILK